MVGLLRNFHLKTSLTLKFH